VETDGKNMTPEPPNPHYLKMKAQCTLHPPPTFPSKRLDEKIKKERAGEPDFAAAGVKEKVFGKNNQFHHRIQMPWEYRKENGEFDLIGIIESITKQFTVIESISMGGVHSARICDNKVGGLMDIEIHSNKIVVYPTSNEHLISSKRLYELLKYY
jgi:hypothetical protein